MKLTDINKNKTVLFYFFNYNETRGGKSIQSCIKDEEVSNMLHLKQPLK